MKIYVKRLIIFFFHINRPKNFIQDFYRLENDEISFHAFPDSVGTLSQRAGESAWREYAENVLRTKFCRTS